MILHRERRQPLDPEPFIGSVEQRDVGLDHGRRQRLTIDGETVILAGDLHLSRLQVLNRMIGTPMAHVQLIGPRAQGQRQQLMAETDAEHWQPSIQKAPNDGHRVDTGRRGITRTIGKEYAIRGVPQDVGQGCRSGNDSNPTASADEAAQDVLLRTIIDGHHMITRRGQLGGWPANCPWPIRPCVRLLAGNLLSEVHSFQTGPTGRHEGERGDVDRLAGDVDEGAARCAAVADATRQAPCVNVGNGDKIVPA